jgi:hypothetical protein
MGSGMGCDANRIDPIVIKHPRIVAIAPGNTELFSTCIRSDLAG